MIALPISLICAMILGFLLFRLWVVDRRVTPLSWLLLICALQSLILALVQYYHFDVARPLQAIGASIIPAVAWVSFATTAIRPARPGDLMHLAAPVAAITALIIAPPALDLLIPLAFLAYGGAILWICRKGPDALPRLRLAAAATPTVIWVIIGASLVLSAFNDAIIIWSIIVGIDWVKPIVISLHSALSLLVIGVLSLSDTLSPTPADPTPEPETQAADSEILAQLQTLMTDKRPYLDPDLTLIKLARKLGVPAKRLSAAVNRATHDNVSRYINASRIAAAQAALRSGQPVTQAMFAAGFNTKSNFNREFLRVTGQTPTAWVTAQTANLRS